MTQKHTSGFTLVELLVVVLIIVTLVTIAAPSYLRSEERARATEAMEVVKAANDAVYAYAAERGECPVSFDKILVTIPGTTESPTTVKGKYFTYTLNAATSALIPGTNCGGVLATRHSKDTNRNYMIWNPYQVIDSRTKKRTLACTASEKKGIATCKAIGVYTNSFSPN